MIDKRIKQIAGHYGSSHQQRQCIEELTELSLALQQYRKGKATIYDIASEIADVQIMLQQMMFFFGLSSKVEEETEFKINRQLERIRNE